MIHRIVVPMMWHSSIKPAIYKPTFTVTMLGAATYKPTLLAIKNVDQWKTQRKKHCKGTVKAPYTKSTPALYRYFTVMMLISNFSQIQISDFKIRYKSGYQSFLHRPTNAVGLLISHSRSVWCVGVTARGVTEKGTDKMHWQRTVHGLSRLSRPGRGGTERN